MFGHDDTDQNDQVNKSLTDSPIPPELLVDDTLTTTTSDNSTPATLSQNDDTDSANNEPDKLTSLPSTSNSNDLLSIKQQALQQLTPLIGHLDQTPDEKFHTTMMMIQSSDNQSLIKDAYAAAQQITDDKARAQALLDVVNEINYFTPHPLNES